MSFFFLHDLSSQKQNEALMFVGMVTTIMTDKTTYRQIFT